MARWTVKYIYVVFFSVKYDGKAFKRFNLTIYHWSKVDKSHPNIWYNHLIIAQTSGAERVLINGQKWAKKMAKLAKNG